MFFTKGVGKHREKLTSFELALRSAGIAACNLVRVSSIFPPKCRILSRAQGIKLLEPGQVTFVVMSEAATREPHRLIAATVGVAIPRDRDTYGYLSEHHSFGESEDIASEAGAQTTDAIGVRAQGMAGAFTAVADDATATYWNPAGLAGGALANGLLEYANPDRDFNETVRGVAAAYPALGITYYRLPVSQIRVTTSTAGTPVGRQDQGVLSLYGVTVGQSFGEHLVVGTTVKLLRAADTSADFDVGVMATFGPARIGATLRDVTEPSFGT